jgi:hypothetical protein
MASAGVLGTVMVDDQRSHIKIETLRGKNPTEIHIALHEVCGGQRNVVQFPIGLLVFVKDFVTINNDSRPGRLKTSTDE